MAKPIMFHVRTSRVGVMLLVVLALSVAASAQRVAVRSGGAADEPEGQYGVLALVSADMELAEYLQRGRDLAAQGDYTSAAEIFQSLLLRADGGFVADASTPGRYHALHEAVNAAIAEMGDEGLAAYRRLSDARAESLYELARAENDATRFMQVATRYRHTMSGPLAMEALAQLCYDRGRFHEASHWWSQRLATPLSVEDNAVTLARLAAAQHLAGDVQGAHATWKELEALPEELADAWPRESLDAVLAMTDRPNVAMGSRADYPGLWALPGGRHIAEDILAPEMLVWQVGEPGRYPVLDTAAIRNDTGQRGSYYGSQSEGALLNTVVDGIAYQALADDDAEAYAVPAYLQPVVMDGVVYFRTGNEVVACDLLTGQRLWESNLQAEGGLPSGLNNYYYHSYYDGASTSKPDLMFTDSGHYALAGAGDILIAVGPYVSDKTLDRVARSNASLADVPGLKLPEINAYSISQQGKTVWASWDKGIPDEVKGMVLVSPPSVAEGRVYIVGLLAETYHLLSFDLATGELLFRQRVSRQPAIEPEQYYYQANYELGVMAHHVSAPVVSQGRAYVATNAGIVASFDSETGAPSWAWAYSTAFSGRGSVCRRKNQQWASPNPLIVSDGRLYVMPSDSLNLYCLDATTGRKLWDRSGEDQEHLTYLPGQRILLSGPEAIILDAVKGTALARPKVQDICGRPAVTESSLYLPGPGLFYEVGLVGDGAVTPRVFTAPEALFGNMVAAEGTLISANSLGVAMFSDYQQTYDRQQTRLSDLPDAQSVAGYYQAGMLAMRWGRIDDALSNLQECQSRGNLLHMDLSGYDLGRKIFYVMSARACDGESLEDQRAWLDKAGKLAQEDIERVHNKLQMIQWYIASDDIQPAVKLAHALAEEHGDMQVADLKLDDAKLVLAALDEKTPRVELRQLMQDGVLRQLIAVYGQAVYASFDAKAEKAYRKARRNRSVRELQGVVDRWPNSIWAGPAELGMAEYDYDESQTIADVAARTKKLAEARGGLTQLSQSGDPVLAGQADVVLAVLAARENQMMLSTTSAQQAMQRFADAGIDIETFEMQFSDIDGTIAMILGSLVDTPDEPVETPAAGAPFELPVRERLVVPLVGGHLLADSNGQPEVDAHQLLVANSEQMVLVDITAVDAASARRWAFPMAARQGVFAADGASVIAADANVVVGLDRQTGAELWRHAPKAGMTAAALSPVYVAVFTSDDTLTVLDARTGRKMFSREIEAPGAAWQFADDYLLVHSPTDHWLECLDLTNKARTLHRWDAQEHLGFTVFDAGRMAVQVDGDISGVKLSAPAAPLWRRSVPAKAKPRLLASDGGHVVLGYTGPSSSRLEVLNGDNGEGVWRVETLPYRGVPTWAIAAQLAGDRLALLCGARAEADAEVDSQDASLAYFDLMAGRCVWQNDVLPGKVSGQRVMGPISAGGYLLIAGEGGKLAAIRQDTGLWERELLSEEASAPFIVDGNVVVVPQAEGIAIYESR